MTNSFVLNDIDFDLVGKFQSNTPRYTSYPTADRFTCDYQMSHHISRIVDGNFCNQDAISLYVHIPFCNTLCLFCACNKIITNDRKNIDSYIDYLEKEIILYAKLMHKDTQKRLKVAQLHFGGGSPSWMSIEQTSRVMDILRKYFDLNPTCEIAMEIDPRHAKVEFLEGLYQLGFNRLSFGMQDFDEKVQKAVNRIQSFEQNKLMLESAQSIGFKSTNVDLIYGLPYQSVDSFASTLDKIIELSPDRIALFNYAHIPSTIMPQTRIYEHNLPDIQTKLNILHLSIKRLIEGGYVFIGMDHFAKPDDELALALKANTLQRNFQGYSTLANHAMLSFGVSSIGYLFDSYYQNIKDLDTYKSTLDRHELPVLRGIILCQDDQIRSYVITHIMCRYLIDITDIENRFSIQFDEYFALEMKSLNSLAHDRLLELQSSTMYCVTSLGKMLIRNIAAVFDTYLRKDRSNVTVLKPLYSKAI